MVFLDHVQNLHIHAEKTHKDSGAHCMNMLILYMVQKTHTGPYYRVLALFMCGVVGTGYSCTKIASHQGGRSIVAADGKAKRSIIGTMHNAA